MLVVLGNRHAIHSLDNGETFDPLPKGKRATTVEIPDDMSLVDALRAIDDLWPKHSGRPAKSITVKPGEVSPAEDTWIAPPPAWVASDSEALATLVAANFGGIEIRDLELDESGTNDGQEA